MVSDTNQVYAKRGLTGVAWPAVLILRPGPNVPGTLDADPPDGTMLAFCALPP